MDDREKFEYNYYAPTEEERREINSILKEYQPVEENESKIERLRALDKRVKLPAKVFAYVFGVIAALVLGTGMCLAMKIIGDMMVLGIIIGVIGIAMCIADYYIYEAILRSRKKKRGAEILKLSKEILNERRDEQ